MLLGTVIAINQMITSYGHNGAWLIISFLFAAPLFAGSVFASLLIKSLKKGFEKAPMYFLQFILLQAFLAFFWAFQMIYYRAFKITEIFSLFEFGVYIFVLFVYPLSQAYYRLMERYPVLPWHFMQYLMSLLGSLVFWGLLIFVFGVFVPEPPPIA